MDALLFARLQFATTTSIHFLFVLLTLGLLPLVAVMQTRYAITGNSVHRRMTRFWGMLYLINYALGIATGIVQEFQFGLNWSGLSSVAGSVFGAPLALETLVAFFLESTFLGMWIFGWDRLNKWLHLALIWMVTLTAYLSVFWVLVANEFMQHPNGFESRNGILRITDFAALVNNPNLAAVILHVVLSGLFAGGFFLAGVSAYHFIKRTEELDFFRRSLRQGILLVAVTGPFTFFFGSQQFEAFKLQPGKLVGTPEAAHAQAEYTAQFGPGD